MSYLCEGLDVIVVLEAHHVAASLRVRRNFFFFASFFPRSLLLLFFSLPTFVSPSEMAFNLKNPTPPLWWHRGIVPAQFRPTW